MDEQTATLRKIEAVAMSLELRGRWITEDLDRLVNLPSWETNAEDMLAKAEHQARRAVQTLEQARALIERKRLSVAAG